MFVQSKPTDIEIPKMSDFDTVNNNLEMGMPYKIFQKKNIYIYKKYGIVLF